MRYEVVGQVRSVKKRKMKEKFKDIIEKINKDESLKNLFQYNNFTKDIEFIKHSPWHTKGLVIDSDIIELKYYLSSVLNIETTTSVLHEIGVKLSRMNQFNPLKQYLENLKWDGINRLDKWLIEICGATSNAYTKTIGIKVLVAAVARVFNPGCKFDYMMILEGNQGIGKSTLLNILGGQWYLDTHISTSENKKDLIDLMRTAWIVEISDMAGFRKQDIEYLKSFLSRQIDRVRLPYARKSEDFPRQCIFIGTHNPSGDNEYFRDDTGNRRFWPVECTGKIKVELMREWKDQLWAEAVHFFKQGETLYLDNSDPIDILINLHADREPIPILNNMLSDYLKEKDFVSINELITNVFKLEITRLSYRDLRSRTTTIGIFMRKHRWVKGRNEKRHYYFREGYCFDDGIKKLTTEVILSTDINNIGVQENQKQDVIKNLWED